MRAGDYNDRLPILPSILFGAFFTLAVAWMLGNICLHRLPVPWTIALAAGAAVESNIVFLLLVSGVGNRVSFGLLGAVCVTAFWWVGRGAARLMESHLHNVEHQLRLEPRVHDLASALRPAA